MTRCLICKTSTKTTKAKVRPFIAQRMYLGNPPEIVLAECPKCGFKYYVPRPSEKKLTRIYINYRDAEYQKQRYIYEKITPFNSITI